jgi:hypothetical protein
VYISALCYSFAIGSEAQSLPHFHFKKIIKHRFTPITQTRLDPKNLVPATTNQSSVKLKLMLMAVVLAV